MRCKKIEMDCFNREITITDSNFLINVMNFYYESGINSLGKLLIKTSNIFSKICNYCADYNKIYVSDILNEQELLINEKSSLRNNLKIVADINSVGLHIIECYLLKILRVLMASEENYLNDLQNIANRFTKSKRLNRINRPDLSLFLLGIKISIMTKKNVILITDDLPLYLFSKKYYQNEEIEICRKIFPTNKVIPLLPLTYTLNMYKNCKFEDFFLYFDYLEDYYSSRSNPHNLSERMHVLHELGKEILRVMIEKEIGVL